MVGFNEIKSFSHDLARQFRPEQIVLFGSFARGTAVQDSDVDLLVVMQHRGSALSQAVQIIRSLAPRFAVDLIVRSPEELKKRLQHNDQFLKKAIAEGQVLYEAADA